MGWVSVNEELLKKLRYKQGQAVVFNAPPGFSLGIENGRGSGDYDFVLLFVNNSDEAKQWLPQVIPSLQPDAMFWIAYPKQSSKIKTDINRDSLANLVQEATEYRVVSNVAIDDTWSALRVRRKDLVKSAK